jgi:hypothetical protein
MPKDINENNVNDKASSDSYGDLGPAGCTVLNEISAV